MKLWSLVIALAACTGSPKQEHPVSNSSPTDSRVAELRKLLDEAAQESLQTLAPELFGVRPKVQALVDQEPRAWWESVTPVQSYWLFELSPSLAARAPADVRAKALCAGVEKIGNGEWWSVPGDVDNGNTQRVVRSQLPVARCLVALLDSKEPLRFLDSDAKIAAEENGWTVADRAGGMLAMMLNEKYYANESPADRAAQRAELRSKIK